MLLEPPLRRAFPCLDNCTMLPALHTVERRKINVVVIVQVVASSLVQQKKNNQSSELNTHYVAYLAQKQLMLYEP